MDKRIKTIWISILIVVALISLLDILFLRSGIFGTEQQYISGEYLLGTWDLFLKIAIGLMIVFGLAYYFYYSRDISETLSVISGSLILWRFGASDVLFFLFQGKWLPERMPWLVNNVPIGTISQLFSFSVTPFTLLISVAIGLTVVYFTTKMLRFRF